MDNQTRDSFIDVLRGFAIIIVVIGHSFLYSFTNPNEVYIYKAILSFQMPLFMFVSGLTLKNRGVANAWLFKKFNSLVIPFMLWLFIPRLFTHDWNEFGEYLLSVLWNPDNGYWFLLALFFCHMLFWGSRRIVNDNVFYELIVDGLFLMGLCVLSLVRLPLGVNSLSWYYLFYLCGYYCTKTRFDKNRFLTSAIVSAIGLVVWVFLLHYWHVPGVFDFCLWIENSYAINGVIVRLLDRFFSIMLALSGVTWFSFLVHYISKRYKLRFAELIGRNTLEVYVLHYFFLNMFSISNVYASVIINIILGIALPLLISIGIRNGKLSKIIFGR